MKCTLFFYLFIGRLEDDWIFSFLSEGLEVHQIKCTKPQFQNVIKVLWKETEKNLLKQCQSWLGFTKKSWILKLTLLFILAVKKLNFYWCDFWRRILNYFLLEILKSIFLDENVHIFRANFFIVLIQRSGGELLELRLLNTWLVDTFWPFGAVFTYSDNCSNHQD